MTAQARKIVVINRDAMLQDGLFARMSEATDAQVTNMVKRVNTVVAMRYAFEMDVERKDASGALYSGSCPDADRLVKQFTDNQVFARFAVAMNLDVRSYFFPQSQDGGKSSTETSNLKSYKKGCEIADAVWSGHSTLENVVKVWSVCAHVAAERGDDVLPRNVSELFLNASRITRGTSELFDALDEYRAKHMSTGASTQTSQMVRQLVALGSATDVRSGREKHTRIHRDGLVLNALMRRFGILSDVDASNVDLEALLSDTSVSSGDAEMDAEIAALLTASEDADDYLTAHTYVWSHVFGEDTATVTAPVTASTAKRVRKSRARIAA